MIHRHMYIHTHIHVSLSLSLSLSCLNPYPSPRRFKCLKSTGTAIGRRHNPTRSRAQRSSKLGVQWQPESWNRTVPQPQILEKKDIQRTSSKAQITIFGVCCKWILQAGGPEADALEPKQREPSLPNKVQEPLKARESL